MAGVHNLNQILKDTTSKIEPFTYKDKNGDPINLENASL